MLVQVCDDEIGCLHDVSTTLQAGRYTLHDDVCILDLEAAIGGRHGIFGICSTRIVNPLGITASTIAVSLTSLVDEQREEDCTSKYRRGRQMLLPVSSALAEAMVSGD